jgi:hypothetical protein
VLVVSRVRHVDERKPWIKLLSTSQEDDIKPLESWKAQHKAVYQAVHLKLFRPIYRNLVSVIVLTANLVAWFGPGG